MAISVGYCILTGKELKSIESNCPPGLDIETIIYYVTADASSTKEGVFVCCDSAGNWYTGTLSWSGSPEKPVFSSTLNYKPHPLHELMCILRLKLGDAGYLALWRYIDSHKGAFDDGRQ